jgi:hypothetical protein
VETEQEREEVYERKTSTKTFSGFFKNFAPSAKEKLKQSFWTLVIHLIGEK